MQFEVNHDSINEGENLKRLSKLLKEQRITVYKYPFFTFHCFRVREKHEVCGVHYEIERDNVKQTSHVKTVYISDIKSLTWRWLTSL